MDAATTEKTLELMKTALSKSNDDITKSITTGSNLVAYDLQAPAKNLYPVITPLRNSIPRVSGKGGVATNWRVVSAITGSGYDASPWVAEGQRSARMSYTTAPKAANYVTIGEEDQVTFEAVSAGQTFEDVRATMAMRLLQKTMIKEESGILAGNNSLALGTQATPTLAAAGSGATLPALTYSVIIVPLTLEGYLNSTRTAPLACPTTQVVTGADGGNYTVNGGAGGKSAAATQAVTLGQTLSVSWAVTNGAVAYGVYIGAAGAEKLEAITTINSITFSAPLAGTGQAATAMTADWSRNSLGFDGLLTSAFANIAGGAYVKALATGTAGTGTPLTASGRGSVAEIDDMLKTMWDTARIGATVLYVNSQELKNLTNKVLSNTTGPLLRYEPGQGEYDLTASGKISYYFNPYTADGGRKIPVRLHPLVPPGTILAYAEQLPAWYQNNNVQNVAEVHCRRDYYQLDYPIRTRAYETGVYAEEVLAVYAPFAMAVITNIANG